MGFLGATGVNWGEGAADKNRLRVESVPTEPDRYENPFLASNKAPPASQSSLSSARRRESSGWRGALYLMLDVDFRTYLARSVRFLPDGHFKGVARAEGGKAKKVINCMRFPIIFTPFS